MTFGEMAGMSDFERANWNGGYGPDGRWWARDDDSILLDYQTTSEVLDRTKATCEKLKEALARYAVHDNDCKANDMDPLDDSPWHMWIANLFKPLEAKWLIVLIQLHGNSKIPSFVKLPIVPTKNESTFGVKIPKQLSLLYMTSKWF